MEFVMEQDKIKVEKDGETKEFDVLFTFDLLLSKMFYSFKA